MGSRVINKGERLAAIERMLFRSSEGMRAVEIARACGVDRRTIYRDLSMLEKIGVPVTQQDGRYIIKRDYYLTTMRLNYHEAMALFLSARAHSRQAEQQNPHIISALSKLSAAMPEPLASHVSELAEAARGNAVDRNFVQVLETMTHAWADRRKVRVWSSPAKDGSTDPRDFAIYFIEPTMNGGIYAVGFDGLAQKIKTFKLEQVRRVKLLNEHYEIPAAFERRRYMASMWGATAGDDTEKTRVVLAFSADVTPLIKERVWHSSQSIETLPDKRCTLSVLVDDWRELLPWIRAWGTQVEVLGPQSLRQELAAEAARLQSVYGAVAER